MRRFILCVLAACTGDPSVEIVRPADGAMITTSEPIELEVRAKNVSPYEGQIYLDGALVPRSALTGDCNGEGTSLITWNATGVANGSHELRVACLEDLNPYDDKITLVFARP